YGNPRVVVLDEPNSNLDEEGEACLLQAVMNLRQLKATVVLVTHKPNILSTVDNIILMQDGQLVLCGPRQEVLNKLAAMQQQQKEQAQQEMLKRQEELKAKQAAAALNTDEGAA
ncbi:MAG: hypothetical protein RR014_04010, partial [Bilophila sp.]